MADVPKIKLNSGYEIPAIGLGECTFENRARDWRADTEGCVMGRNVAVEAGRCHQCGGVRVEGRWV